MQRLKVKAETRETGKKGVARRLRAGGWIPAVLYGQGEGAIGLSVAGKEFTTMVKGTAGMNALIDLEFEGKKEGKPAIVMVKDYQTDILTRKITHIDFLKINLKEKVTIKVPIHLVGKAAGVVKGGIVEQQRRELEIRCLPDKIPESIEVDITPLDLGHSLHINQITLPEGAEIQEGADFAVVSVVAPREEVAAPEAAVTPEAATGEGAATAEGAAASAPGAEPAKPEKK